MERRKMDLLFYDVGEGLVNGRSIGWRRGRGQYSICYSFAFGI